MAMAILSHSADGMSTGFREVHYRRKLDLHLAHADGFAHELCGECLRKMEAVLSSLGRRGEWTALLAEIRAAHRRRPWFMEVLDGLERRTIVEARKASKPR